jgi:hypothetical protein
MGNYKASILCPPSELPSDLSPQWFGLRFRIQLTEQLVDMLLSNRLTTRKFGPSKADTMAPLPTRSRLFDHGNRKRTLQFIDPHPPTPKTDLVPLTVIPSEDKRTSTT